MKIPRRIQYRIHTGYRGEGLMKTRNLERENKKETIMTLDMFFNNAEEKYKKGYRIYSYIGNRHNVTVLRYPSGKLKKLGEEFS